MSKEVPYLHKLSSWLLSFSIPSPHQSVFLWHMVMFNPGFIYFGPSWFCFSLFWIWKLVMSDECVMLMPDIAMRVIVICDFVFDFVFVIFDLGLLYKSQYISTCLGHSESWLVLFWSFSKAHSREMVRDSRHLNSSIWETSYSGVNTWNSLTDLRR